jgi:hypothetical protein
MIFQKESWEAGRLQSHLKGSRASKDLYIKKALPNII